MHYEFPEIKHIDQVIPHIEGCPAFIVADKNDYTVIDYVKTTVDAFPSLTEKGSDIRRECRGLLFNKHGELVRRSYHKFFNMNERDETKEDKINWSLSYTTLEKLDGSMVTPFNNNGHIRWATRKGITSVAMQAECFVAKNPNYITFSEFCLSNGITPIFEWCSPYNKVVVDYPEQLVLTGLRNINSGEYVCYSSMQEIANGSWNIPMVGPYPMSDWDVLVDVEGVEGVVVRFKDGHMVKVKTSWYCGIHKALQGLLFEKDLLRYILDETLDDVVPFLSESERSQVQEYQRQVMSNLIGYTQMCYEYWRLARVIGRKNFGLDTRCPKMVKTVVFQCWDDISDVKECLISLLRKNTVSQNRVDGVRDVFGHGITPWKARFNLRMNQN